MWPCIILMQSGSCSNTAPTRMHVTTVTTRSRFTSPRAAVRSNPCRLLLDAGSDVHGVGDLHQMDVIGWATLFTEVRRDVVDLLVERGARHHVFSAIALGDLDLLDAWLSADASDHATSLRVRAGADGPPLRRSPRLTDLSVACSERVSHYRTLELLIELGADLEAQDAKGRTPLAVAMLRGDWEAMRRLHAAGAKVPTASTSPNQACSQRSAHR